AVLLDGHLGRLEDAAPEVAGVLTRLRGAVGSRAGHPGDPVALAGGGRGGLHAQVGQTELHGEQDRDHEQGHVEHQLDRAGARVVATGASAPSPVGCDHDRSPFPGRRGPRATRSADQAPPMSSPIWLALSVSAPRRTAPIAMAIAATIAAIMTHSTAEAPRSARRARSWCIPASITRKPRGWVGLRLIIVLSVSLRDRLLGTGWAGGW